MTKKQVFLIVQSVLCVLIAVILSVAAVRIYMEGSAADWIYTREKAVAAITPVIPLFVISLAMTIYGLVNGIEDENKDKPSPDVKIDGPDFNKVGPEKAARRVLIRRVLLAAAICFVVMGIFNGSMRDVLVKAIKICTECVGLG